MTLQYINDSLQDEVLAIADQRLGRGYLTVDSFTCSGAIVLVAIEFGKAVGFVLFHIKEQIDFPVELTKMFGQPHRSVYVKSIAVKEENEQKGFATALLKMVINIGMRQNALCCYGHVWIAGNNGASARIFESLGFEEVMEIADFWYLDSVKKQFQCPVCGFPCHCKAHLVCRPLVNQGGFNQGMR